jgi:hypothetical protein
VTSILLNNCRTYRLAATAGSTFNAAGAFWWRLMVRLRGHAVRPTR